MSKKEEVVPSKLKPEVEALAKKIETGLAVNKADGIITEKSAGTKDPGVYEQNLPEGITKGIVETVSTYDTQFIAASALAVGNIGVDTLKGNKKLDHVSAEISMGPHNKVRHTLDREKTYPGGPKSNGDPVVKAGVLKTEVDIKGGHNSGQLKKVRDSICEIASTALASGAKK